MIIEPLVEKTRELNSIFDEPLKKTLMTLKMIEVLEAVKEKPELRNVLAEIFEWANKVYDAGNMANNINIMITRMNIGLNSDLNEKQKELDNLLKSIDWNQ